MSHNPPARADEFIETAIGISDAVEGGASPADPEVLALLQSVSEDFGVEVKAGDDTAEVIRVEKTELTYTNGLGGDDLITGRGETDVIVGGAGDDTLFGRGGDDALFGGSGDDLLKGGSGEDFLRGGEGDDDLFGGRNDDTLEGSAGNDDLFGQRGDDALEGGDGEDRLFGGKGDDFLSGGSGDDFFKGGRGADTFFFDPSNPTLGDDFIDDFKIGTDRVLLSAEDILNSAPGIANADGDPAFSAGDLDADNRWDLEASADHNLVVRHPGGTIEFDGVDFDASLSFAALVDLGVVDVEA